MGNTRSCSGGQGHAHYIFNPIVFCEVLQEFLGLTHTKKDILFVIRDWNTKVESQEIPGVTGKFGLGVQNEAGQRLTEFAKRMHWS